MPRKKQPPRLYQRPDTGEWIIRDGGRTVRTGSRSECGSETPDDAKRALADYLSSTAAEVPTGPQQPHQITAGQVLAIYADYAAQRVQSKGTLAYAIQALAPFWGELTCDAIRGETCRRYEKQRSVAPSTVRRELGVLQAALNHAHREGFLVYPIAVSLPPSAPPRERWLTRVEVAAILRHAVPHLRRFILISLYTGTRASAVSKLRWTPALESGWVDLDNCIIHRRGAGEVVTKKRRGAVRMPRQLAGHMRRWAKSGGSHVVMFRGKPVSSVKKALADACKRAETAAKDREETLDLSGVTPHVLKHTAVTWAFQRGMSVEDAADYFSTSSQTLESVYRQHSPYHQDRAVAAMERR
ncbi:MAG: tyrosine-type recombinase/integrase [Pseudomonadota bacterium]